MTQLSQFERQLLQIMWEMSGPGRTGEPRGAERKKLLRVIRRLRTRGAKPIKPGDAPGSGHEAGVRFMEALEHNGFLRVSFRGPWPGGVPGPRMLPDLAHLAEVPVKDRYARLPKPWKGRAGRQAGTERKSTRRARTIALRKQGLSYARIAEKLGCAVRTVQRDLSGR